MRCDILAAIIIPFALFCTPACSTDNDAGNGTQYCPLVENGTAPTSDCTQIVDGAWIYMVDLINTTYASSVSPGSDYYKGYRIYWERGYRYEVLIPNGYTSSEKLYPMIVFLHGGDARWYPYSAGVMPTDIMNGQVKPSMHTPPDDPYVLVVPAKEEFDWSAEKLADVMDAVKANMRIDENRTYLTGLSMGGRGTFIVAAGLPDVFAAIMPLSPHHWPTDYRELADDIAHLPIWMAHGNEDTTSDYALARNMAERLANLGADITFTTLAGVGHWGWGNIYSNPQNIDWLLGHNKRDRGPSTVSASKSWGQLKAESKQD